MSKQYTDMTKIWWGLAAGDLMMAGRLVLKVSIPSASSIITPTSQCADVLSTGAVPNDRVDGTRGSVWSLRVNCGCE